MSDTNEFAAIGARVRNAREVAGIKNLEQFADKLLKEGCERPSLAKLSRIETGVQLVTLDILPAVSKITSIPARELRPDLVSVAKQIMSEVA